MGSMYLDSSRTTTFNHYPLYTPPKFRSPLKEIIMPNKILVTYASRTGSTTGVAQAIGTALTQGGAQVEVRPMSEVQDLTPYDAVVAGSAIHNQAWLPEALQFIQAHQAELAQKPFADFSVCITLAMKEGDYRSVVAGWVQPVRDLVKPVSEGLFAGVLDINKVPSFSDRLKFRASVAFGVWDEGDHRDWTAIHTWANELQTKLH